MVLTKLEDFMRELHELGSPKDGCVMILSLNGGPSDGRSYEARHCPEVIEITTRLLIDEPSARANAKWKAVYRRKEYPQSTAALHRVEYLFTGWKKSG